MQIEGTKEAFKAMIFTKSIHKLLNCKLEKVLEARRRFKKGNISINTMENLLRRAGYTVAVEIVWDAPELKIPGNSKASQKKSRKIRTIEIKKSPDLARYNL